MPKELLTKSAKSKHWIVLPILGIVLLSLAVLVCCNQNNSESKPLTNPKSELSKTTDTKLGKTKQSFLSSTSSINELADSLSVSLRKEGLGFTSDLVSMIAEKKYEKGATHLTRQYKWTISFPVTIGISDAEIAPKRGTDKILIRIKRLKIGKRFAYGDKTATTIAKEDWNAENSEDQSFWAGLEEVTKSRFSEQVISNKKITNGLRNKTINVVVEKINKILEGTGLENSKFEFIIENISS